MPTISVLNMQGSEVAKMELASTLFDAAINLNCVRTVANRQLGRQRQGTAATKTKGLIRGGGKKPFRQKGTGNARSGSNRSPVWRGGGTIFGPQPRSFGGRVNRKVTRSAIFSCLTSFAQANQLIAVDAVDMAAPKTKAVIEMLKALNINDGRRVLILTEKTNEGLALSARNLPQVDVINCDNLNVVDLGTHETLVATSGALKRLEEVYS